MGINTYLIFTPEGDVWVSNKIPKHFRLPGVIAATKNYVVTWDDEAGWVDYELTPSLQLVYLVLESYLDTHKGVYPEYLTNWK